MTAFTVGARAALALVALPLLLSACLTRHERGLVDAWLECQDCTDHEADSVRAIGARCWRRPFLLPVLTGIVVSGPDSTRKENIRLQLAQAFAMTREYMKTHTRPTGWQEPDSAVYVQHYLASYVSTCRLRAAISVIQVAGLHKLPAIDTTVDYVLWAEVQAFQARAMRASPP